MLKGLRVSPKAMFLGNLKNKLFAFFLALVVWSCAYAASEDTRELTFRVHLTTQGDYAIVDTRVLEGKGGAFTGQNGQVTLIVSGQEGDLERLATEALTTSIVVDRDAIEIDLTRLDYYGLPGGFRVLNAEPERLSCTIEPTILQRLDINVTVHGSAAPGMEPKGERLRPSFTQAAYEEDFQALVRGPKGAFAQAGDVVVGIDSVVIDSSGKTTFEFYDRPLEFLSAPEKYRGLLRFEGVQRVDVAIDYQRSHERVTVEAKVKAIIKMGFIATREHGTTLDDKIRLNVVGPESGLEELEQAIKNEDFKVYVKIKESLEKSDEFAQNATDIIPDPPLAVYGLTLAPDKPIEGGWTYSVARVPEVDLKRIMED